MGTKMLKDPSAKSLSLPTTFQTLWFKIWPKFWPKLVNEGTIQANPEPKGLEGCGQAQTVQRWISKHFGTHFNPPCLTVQDLECFDCAKSPKFHRCGSTMATM